MEMEEKTHVHKHHNVHKVLAQSHFIYLILFLVGVILDLIFKTRIFNSSFMMPIGFALLLLATFIILWSVKTSNDLKKEDKNNIKKETFCRGPYCYTRIPTYLGLFLLVLGFGIVTNAFFVVLTTIISFLIAKFVFQDKVENILANKYGAPYLEYKKMVKF